MIRIVPVLAVLGALGWAVWVRINDAMHEPEPQERTVAVAVEVARAQRGLIRDVRSFTGSLRARSQVDIAPRISGRQNRLLVDIGDQVGHGQLIAQMDDEEHQQEVEQAEADLLVARATLQERESAAGIALRDFERAERLREQRIASESELDAAQSRYESAAAAVRVAEAEVARRQAALRVAQVRLSYCTITADWDITEQTGPAVNRVVGERYVDEGATIAANSPIVSLLDIDQVIAVVHVSEADYNALSLGLKALIRASQGSGRVVEGTIVRMAPAFDEGSRQARIEVAINNPEQDLKPGMFVTVDLELRRDENAQLIARQALVQREGQESVFMVNNDGTVSLVPVQVGIRNREQVQIEQPSLDQPVVILGQHLLSDGTPVILAPEQDWTP